MASQTRTRKRSDSIRKRRNHGTKSNRRRGRRRRTLRSRALPPMVARSGKFGGLRAQKRRSRARRRFDIALAIPGAEIRLPAIPAVRFGWRALSGFLVVLLLSLLYTLSNLPTFHISLAEVQGIQRLTTQEVNTVLKVAGKSIFAVDPRQLEHELQVAFPELYEIAIRAGFPAEVSVMVNERQPVLAWQQDGLTLWVDESGVAFPPRGKAEIPVTVEGLDTPETGPNIDTQDRVFLDPHWIPAIMTVKDNAPEGTTLLYDSHHGLGWLDPSGWQVFVGPGNEDIQEKMLVYGAMVEYINQKQITPALISVEYVDAPYFRMER